MHNFYFHVFFSFFFFPSQLEPQNKQPKLTRPQAIREATASERLTLAEEYENQVSWRASHDKLTFIICQPLSSLPSDEGEGEEEGGKKSCATSIRAGGPDAPERMVGDVNLFLYADDEDEDGGIPSARPRFCAGEVDIMVAERRHRGKGLGGAAVRAFLQYVWRHLDGVLREYAEDKGDECARAPPRLRLLMAKVRQDNRQSIALFRSLGFEQEGGVNYFGEVKLVLRRLDEFAADVPEGYRELVYSRSSSQGEEEEKEKEEEGDDHDLVERKQ